VIPHPEHVRNAAGFERAPDLRRPGDAFEQTGLVNQIGALKCQAFQTFLARYPQLYLTRQKTTPATAATRLRGGLTRMEDPPAVGCRFTPQSGHPDRAQRCLLLAQSGHGRLDRTGPVISRS
jgi:hypothetical protein